MLGTGGRPAGAPHPKPPTPPTLPILCKPPTHYTTDGTGGGKGKARTVWAVRAFVAPGRAGGLHPGRGTPGHALRQDRLGRELLSRPRPSGLAIEASRIAARDARPVGARGVAILERLPPNHLVLDLLRAAGEHNTHGRPRANRRCCPGATYAADLPSRRPRADLLPGPQRRGRNGPLHARQSPTAPWRPGQETRRERDAMGESLRGPRPALDPSGKPFLPASATIHLRSSIAPRVACIGLASFVILASGCQCCHRENTPICARENPALRVGRSSKTPPPHPRRSGGPASSTFRDDPRTRTQIVAAGFTPRAAARRRAQNRGMQRLTGVGEVRGR